MHGMSVVRWSLQSVQANAVLSVRHDSFAYAPRVAAPVLPPRYLRISLSATLTHCHHHHRCDVAATTLAAVPSPSLPPPPPPPSPPPLLPLPPSPLRAQLVFVSACHSEALGSAFVEAGVPHVVAVKSTEQARARQQHSAMTHTLLEVCTSAAHSAHTSARWCQNES
jgi:hypothetical protein